MRPPRRVEYPPGSQRAERAALLGKAARLRERGDRAGEERALSQADGMLMACVEEARSSFTPAILPEDTL